MDLNVLIMAAGLGTRMKSKQAKVLHSISGRSLINHIYHRAIGLSAKRCVMIVGHQADKVKESVEQFHDQLVSRGVNAASAEFVLQAEQKGTGHAVMMAREALAQDNATILLLSGDVPLVRLETLQALITWHRKHEAVATVLTTAVADATGYGRVIRDGENHFQRIVEHRDASPAELKINEINSGIYCFESKALFKALDEIKPTNAQGEYYLTDVLSVLKNDQQKVAVYLCEHTDEVLGINNRVELASAAQKLRARKLDTLMRAGVTIIDPAATYIDEDVEIGSDTIIYPQVLIEGYTRIGEDCTISLGAHIINSTLGNNVSVKDHCLLVDSTLADNAAMGPFAHIRMHAKLEKGATIGNFVEVKKSTIGEGTKAMHLAYLGDATLGKKVNIGAGTITCNYDGKNKHATTIEDNVKIGSDTMLVAPVTIGKGSVTGAGTVVTKNIPENSLAVGVPAVVKKSLV